MMRQETYSKGSTAELFFYATQDNKPKQIVVESVVITNSSNVTQMSLSGTSVTYPSLGVAKVSFVIPTTWYGKYYDTWTFRINGILQTVKQFFDVGTGVYSFSGSDAPSNLDFSWILLQNKFHKGCKEYVRFIVKEIYDRKFAITSPQCSFIYYRSQYKQEQTDWQDCVWDGSNLLMSLMDTSDMKVSEKWYAQVKFTNPLGEIILSPLFKFQILDKYAEGF